MRANDLIANRLFHHLLLTVLLIGLVGCGQKKTETRYPKDSKSWKLKNGVEFTASVESADSPKERSWIWCDLVLGDVSYRIVGPGQSSTWKPMSKIRVSNDEKLTVIPDVEGMYGDAVVLPRGKYAVEFKVATEEFSSVALEVD